MVWFHQSLFTISLVHAAIASFNTSPLVAWSSLSAELLPVHPTSSQVDALFDRWIYNDDVCKFDAVILVNQPGLHASDLRTLSSTSALPKLLDAAPSSAQLSYARLTAEHSREHILQDVSRRCGSRMLDDLDAKALHRGEIEDSKFVINVHISTMASSAGTRKSQMAVVGQQLAEELQSLASAFPSHLVIYSDWDSFSRTPVASLVSRQDPSSSAEPTGGILKRYQLLSPGLILSLFLVFFVLLPIVMIGIQALSSIRSPVRLDGKMLAEYRQKKNQ